MIQARHQHARRADLPQRRGHGADTRRDRGLRPEGRAHGLRRRAACRRSRMRPTRRQTSLDGLRIGVVREYMDKALFTETDEQTHRHRRARALNDLRRRRRRRWSTPAPAARCSANASRATTPPLRTRCSFASTRSSFPSTKDGKPKADHVRSLVEMVERSALFPKDGPTIRELAPAQATGERKYTMNRYLAQRGDSSIKQQRRSDREVDVLLGRASRLGLLGQDRAGSRTRTTT